MWYNKNPQIKEIVKLVNKKDCSEIAKRIMNFMVIVHCSLHKINYRDRQRITEQLKLSSRKLEYRWKEDNSNNDIL